MTSAWADLDKLAVARPRDDGRATLVVRDDRTLDVIVETRALSTVVAICRVLRARHVIAQKHDGRGVVIYAVATAPPPFLVAAVTAAGGALFDGAREHVASAPPPTTVQLDAAFCDLATVVRRRVGVRSFSDALDVLESELRRRTPSEPGAQWRAVFELAALAGELLRADRPGRWIEAPADRVPVALDRGKREIVFPGKLARAIVDGGGESMRALLQVAGAAPPLPVASLLAPSIVQGFSRPMPLLVDRRRVPIERLTWRPLVDGDAPDAPVIAFVDDGDGAVSWPIDQGPPGESLEVRALANLARQPTEITMVDVPHGLLAIVTGGFFAAEALLDRAVMERVRVELGRPRSMLVGLPARGHLIAIDGERATLDDEFRSAFVAAIGREYASAAERDQISDVVLAYRDEVIHLLRDEDT